jgi:ABC-type multidrug transport system ATPase subunit
LGPNKQLIPGNKNIAFVDQEMVIEPYLTVIQNLKSGLIGASYTEPEAQKLIEELLHIAQLEGFENQKVATLSLGQKQRLSLAKAFTFDKPILVFDEPFNNVDAVTRARFIAKLQQLNNKTILSVVHSTTDAFQLGNQVAILHEGKILEHGAIHELYEQPSTLISATYLGQLCAIQLQDSKLHFRPQYLSEKPSQSDDIKLVVKSFAIKNMGDFSVIKLQTNYGELFWFDAVKNANNFKTINQLYIPQNKLLRLC